MLERLVKQFLQPYESKTVVLGLSGGPDSLALFYILLKIKQPFVVAHVNHGWREASQKEAEALQKLAHDHAIPFFLKTCKIEDFKGNLEAAGREIRRAFFREVLKKTGSSGVILGHHANDLTENTLKKLLEGVPLFALSSMQPVLEEKDEPVVWLRPFLEVYKTQIMDYLGDTSFFVDETNSSGQFLRGRMRSEIFPFLREKFGKEVEGALHHAALEAEELSQFLHDEIVKYPSVEGPFGVYVDLTGCQAPYLLKALLYKKLQENGLKGCRGEVLALREALLNYRANFCRIIQGRSVWVDRGYLFILKTSTPSLKEWKISFKPSDDEVDGELTNWKALWKGRGVGVVPDTDISLGYETHLFDKWWSNHKVPAFFRKIAPLIMKIDRPIYEFCTGRSKFPSVKGIKVVIEHCAS